MWHSSVWCQKPDEITSAPLKTQLSQSFLLSLFSKQIPLCNLTLHIRRKHEIQYNLRV